MTMASYRKALPLIELIVVYAAILSLARLSKTVGFGRWQAAHLGFRYFSDTIFHFLLPVFVLAISGRPLSEYGLRTSNLTYHLGIGIKAAVVLIPICLLFPILGLFGTGHDKWSGSIALSIACLLGTGAIVLWLRRDPAGECGSVENFEFLRAIGFLWVSFLVGWALFPLSKTLAKALYSFVFVGCLQEFLFRGYTQSRLNDVFGKAFRVAGVQFGPGLIIASILFGHHHLLASGAQYPWAIWTTAFGLCLGLVREKTGSIVASGFAHGLFLLPTAFFSAS